MRGTPLSPLALSFFICIGVLLSCLAWASTQRDVQGAVDLDGKAVDPLKVARGKVVVLIFMRTDCPISNRYAPTIQQLSAKYSRTTAFWLVYLSKTDSTEAIREHDREFGYDIPALRDPQRLLVKLSGAKVTPEAAVFDAQRHLIYHGRIDNLYEDFGHARKTATTHELDDAIQAAVDGRILVAVEKPAVGCYIADLE